MTNDELVKRYGSQSCRTIKELVDTFGIAVDGSSLVVRDDRLFTNHGRLYPTSGWVVGQRPDPFCYCLQEINPVTGGAHRCCKETGGGSLNPRDPESVATAFTLLGIEVLNLRKSPDESFNQIMERTRNSVKQKMEADYRRKNARPAMDDALDRRDFARMREAAIQGDVAGEMWRFYVYRFESIHGTGSIPACFQPNQNPVPARAAEANGGVIGLSSSIVPAGFFELIPSEYREAAARGDFMSVGVNYYRAAVKEWKRWQREVRRRFNETYKVERTGTFYTFIAPCCVKKTITAERCRLVPRSKSA